MALSGCYAILKYLVVIINFIFFVAGIAVVGVGIWILTDSTMYLQVVQDDTNFHTGLYIMIAAGALMFIVGFLGCCGALRESPCMLVTFFSFLLVILVVEVAAGCWVYTNRNELENMLQDHVKQTVEIDYGTIDYRTKTFDTIQKHLKCCGANGPRDWSSARFNQANKKSGSGMDLALSSSPQFYRLPLSCCNTPDSRQICDDASRIGLSAKIPVVMYKEGCIDKLKEVLSDHMVIAWALLITIAVLEIFGLIFSLVLCCAVRSVDRYKS
ncbi:CD9 antigen [Thrips palmi]|uniref:Tetraspanin n=1 Tax=Thrips palmi TaxID=161013 RepID=A0A6P8YC28_THRPL|nr:CD9 antigen [Thrips palmi]